ncbi:pyridoxamine 5'-phosphate oxidase [soil metagenome]
MKIADLRKEYTKKELNLEQVAQNPILQFQIWFEEALRSKLTEPNAMSVATVSPEGIPSSRILLLKGIDKKGFIFFTNYFSHKSTELISNPHVAANIFWAELERQVRIQGMVEKTNEAISDEYFQSRPRGSQIGAWASPQSSVINDRKILEEKLKEHEIKFEGKAIPRPPHWGGYIIKPFKIEFWQGRPSRLHDRILYTLLKENHWKIERLAP